MEKYRIKMTWGDSILFGCDLSQASAPIVVWYDEDEDEPQSTQYQTANARHRLEDAARLVVDTCGADWWRSPDVDITENELGETLFDGMTQDDYIDSLIESIEED